MVDVFLNEKFVGTVSSRDKFLSDVRLLRREGKLPKIVNLRYDADFNEIVIETSPGRSRRPLIVVEDGVSKFTKELQESLAKGEISWDDLVNKGVVEYLDAAEEEDVLSALYEKDLTKEHTHLEISPILMLGLCTSLVPYSNFGSSSRLIRGSKIQKQALGLYAMNYPVRVDTDANVLHYPQRPLVKSFMHDVFNFDARPSGQNVVIAVMSYNAYNMQDSVIFNGGSIDMGFMRSTYFKPYTSEEKRYSGGLTDEIAVPDKEVKAYRSEKDYRFLEEDGIVYAEAVLDADDVVIGKTSPPRFLGDLEEMSISANTRRESSTVIKQGEKGKVDMVFITENEEGNRMVQVRLRDQRIPEFGDKFASRHGQKGVLGLILPKEDMPFTASGIVPDVIFSPHSLPSRMTISHLIEVMAGKTAALRGKCVDATSFDTPSEQDLRGELLENGFREDGTEIMYNGVTGEQMKVRIFIGNIYYLRLKYMVANKLHARASGRIQLLTRQPIEGRAKGGGLRLGEMEKDCLVAHGASLLLKERFDSDKTLVYICESCGLVALYDSFKKTAYCTSCNSSSNINAVEISYAFKLLLDELKSLLIYPRLNLEDKY